MALQKLALKRKLAHQQEASKKAEKAAKAAEKAATAEVEEYDVSLEEREAEQAELAKARSKAGKKGKATVQEELGDEVFRDTTCRIPTRLRALYVNYLRVCMALDQVERLVPDDKIMLTKDRDILTHELRLVRDALSRAVGLIGG